MSLRNRLGIIALVYLGTVLIAIGLSTLMIRSWDRTVDQRGEARLAADDVAELRLAFSDQETGVRGYRLSPEPEFLEPYRDGSAVERRIVIRLGDRDLRVDDFAAALDAVVAAGERWRVDVAEPTIADPGRAPDDDLALQRFDDVRSRLDDVDRQVTQRLDELEGRADRMHRNVLVVLFASAITTILGTALAASLFRRWVTRPLAEISGAARSLGVDETTPLPHFDAPELEDVRDAIESLQRSLESARDEAIAALHGLEQSAVLAIQVRSELADELGDMPDGWAAHTLLSPAEGVVAGDCFDIGLLDADRMYMVVIDVTGHGAGAALNALKAKSQLRAALRSRLEPGPAISWLSREMLKDEHADLLTASVMVLHLPTGRLRYASAGHPPALLTDGEEVRVLSGAGPLVGAFTASWTTADAEVPPGWTLLVHSDGITDTVGADRERFGDDRLHECITTSEPSALLASIERAVEGFRVGPRSDDATAIAVHRLDVSTSDSSDTSDTSEATTSGTSAATTAPGADTISA
jgi:serine phosphatase RsbU (regulator of sigma subunit)/CHASE3 domain sensor protein